MYEGLAEKTIEVMEKTNAALNATMKPEERAAVEAMMTRMAETRPAAAYAASENASADEDFELTTAAEATEAMMNRIHAFLEVRQQWLYEYALKVYYALEDALAKDPENESLLKHAENMRRAHESQYGKPLPPRG
jgi:hypothetical protein